MLDYVTAGLANATTYDRLRYSSGEETTVSRCNAEALFERGGKDRRPRSRS